MSSSPCLKVTATEQPSIIKSSKIDKCWIITASDILGRLRLEVVDINFTNSEDDFIEISDGPLDRSSRTLRFYNIEEIRDFVFLTKERTTYIYFKSEGNFRIKFHQVADKTFRLELALYSFVCLTIFVLILFLLVVVMMILTYRKVTGKCTFDTKNSMEQPPSYRTLKNVTA